jgi:DNA repair protein RadC
VFLNARHHVICEEVLFVGTIDTALVSTREPIAAALAVNAKAIILAHNHPAGDPSPSPQDIVYSTKLKDACALFDIQLLDHIIVARTRHGSMLGQGYL